MLNAKTLDLHKINATICKALNEEPKEFQARNPPETIINRVNLKDLMSLINLIALPLKNVINLNTIEIKDEI